jgi:tetratricopeptide (TPR) repeat protein
MLDAEYVVDWARSIRAGDILGSPENTAYFRTPLYPFFLAAVFSMPGPDLLSARIFQAILGSLTVVLLMDMAWRRFGKIGGIGTCVLAGASWPLLHFGRELFIESLAVFLGAAFLAAWARTQATSRASRWILLGVLIGLGGAARANFLAILPVAVLAAWFEIGPPRRARHVVWLLIGTSIPLAPIALRNRVVSGEWVALSYQGGLNLWIGNNPESDGMSARLPGFTSWRNEDVEAALAREYGQRLSPGEQDRHYRKLAFEFFAQEPLSAARLLARKAYLFFQGYEIRNNRDLEAIRERDPILSLPLPDFGWILPLALVGVVSTWGRRRELIHLYGFALAMAIGVILFFVCARYRLLAWPALLVLAGAGVSGTLGRGIPGSSRAFRVGLLVTLAVLARIDFLHIRDPDSSQPHFQYGNAYARAGRLEDAEMEYRTALKLAPGFAEARYHLGALFLQEGRIAEALPELEEAARALPLSFRVRRSLAEALEHAGSWERALAVRREAAELSAGAPQDRLALANALGRLRNYREAWEIYVGLESSELANDPYFLLNAGQTTLELKKHEDKGVEFLTRAARHAETRELAWEALAQFYLSLRRAEAALPILSQALLVTTDNANLYRYRAVARYATGDATGAIEDLEKVLELEPNDLESRRKLDEIRAALGR